MTRFFYSDPLAAAWMGKWFGMRLQVGQTSATNLDLPPFREEKWPAIARLAGIGLEADRYFIHPESLHLLEPCDGDSLEITDPDYLGGSCITSVRHSHSKALGLPVDSQYRGEKYRIIQRQGKSFMWPQVEEA